MVVTEPIPERLAALGWTGGELLSDTRFTISYFRTTNDGRIAFGAGVGAAGSTVGRTFTSSDRAISRVVANFDHLFPMLRDVRFEDAWGGSIDISADRFRRSVAEPRPLRPWVRRQRRAGAPGGPGVGGAGDAPERRLARLAMVGRRRACSSRPFRFIGARLIREAHPPRRRLDAGRTPGARCVPLPHPAPDGLSVRALRVNRPNGKRGHLTLGRTSPPPRFAIESRQKRHRHDQSAGRPPRPRHGRHENDGLRRGRGRADGSSCPVWASCWQVEKADVLVYDAWVTGDGSETLIDDLRDLHPDKPVVLTTPGMMLDWVETAGAHGVTPVPFTPGTGDLVTAIEAAIESARAGTQVTPPAPEPTPGPATRTGW
jgi:hypothetical protein